MTSKRVSKRRLTMIFAALSDPTRRDIYERLVTEGELRMSDLATSCPMSLPAVSKHVRVLEEAGLVERRIEGRAHWIGRATGPLGMAAAWIEAQRDGD